MISVELIGINNKEKEELFSEFLKHIAKYEHIKTVKNNNGFTLSYLPKKGLLFFNSLSIKNIDKVSVYKPIEDVIFNPKTFDFSSDIVYVFIKGDYLIRKDKNHKCSNIKRYVSRLVTPYLSEFLTEKNKKPIIIFVLMNSFRVLTNNTKSELHNILKVSLSSFFDSENKGYQEPFTICVDTQKHYAVAVPFLLGIYEWLYKNKRNDEQAVIKEILENELSIYQNFLLTGFDSKDLPFIIKKPDYRTIVSPSYFFFNKCHEKLLYTFSKVNKEKTVSRIDFSRGIDMINTDNYKTRFTALGLSGSGKTCYVIGMYSEMASGIRGWTVCTANEYADRITRQLRKMEFDKESGNERFPVGTDDYKFDDYEFKLYFRNHKIMKFNWIDYAGGILEESSKNPEIIKRLEKSISNSTTLYIFVDGELFCEGTTREKIRKVKNSCSSKINPRITAFMKNHDNTIPPVVFVITKSDICKEYTDLNEIKEILKESFSSIFYNPDSLAYITLISLGDEISHNGYTGEINPVNIQTPFFIGIAHDFSNKCEESMREIEKNRNIREEAIRASRNTIAYDKFSIQEREDHINSNNRAIIRAKYDKDCVEDEKNKREVELSDIEKIVSEQDKKIEKAYSDKYDLEEGGGIFNGFKKYLNRNKIENLKNEIKELEKQNESAKEEKSYNEETIRFAAQKITELNYYILGKEEMNKYAQENINEMNSDIIYQKKIIEDAEQNIKEYIKMYEQYEEMLEDVREELKKQSDAKQFIVIKGGQEVPLSVDEL